MDKKKVVALVAVVLTVVGLVFGTDAVQMVKDAVSGVAPVDSESE